HLSNTSPHLTSTHNHYFFYFQDYTSLYLGQSSCKYFFLSFLLHLLREFIGSSLFILMFSCSFGPFFSLAFPLLPPVQLLSTSRSPPRRFISLFNGIIT